MPKSKIDYLSKYTDRGDSKRHKKSKKKKKKARESSSKIVDGDHDAVLLPLVVNEDNKDEQSEASEDGPVVVDANELGDALVVPPVVSSHEAPKRRQRHDSSDDQEPRADRVTSRRRHDSSSGEDAPKRRGRRRYDSDDEDDKHATKQRRRYDSDNDSLVDPGERMSSGHRAGLQSGGDFSKKEAKIQAKHKASTAAEIDRHGVGETVYRDAQGRKVDQPVGKQQRRELDPAEQAALNTGRVQKEQELTRAQEMARIQASEFARTDDDDELERMRKETIRAGDPMAARAVQKVAKSTGSGPSRPVYKGPPPKPNRYGIRPGFRWDGVDRGNGFEDKLLGQQFSRQHQKEQAYRYSSADM